MRTSIIIILLTIFKVSYPQLQYSIADTSKSWNELQVSGDCRQWGVIDTCYNDQTIFSADTIINNTRFLPVNVYRDSSESIYGLVGYLYENPFDKTVFFMNLDGEMGQLYDFDIDLYDTVVIDNRYIPFPEPVILTCFEIDSLIIDNAYRRKYSLGIFYGEGWEVYDTWIEGIGSMNGLLNSGISASGMSGYMPQLLCHYENDTVKYINPEYDSCYIVNFYPKFSSDHFDTAYVGEPYELQLELRNITSHDTLKFFDYFFPSWMTLDTLTGLIFGVPDDMGEFNIAVVVSNHGIRTDVIESLLVVLDETGIKEPYFGEGIRVFPNPFNDFICIDTPNRQLNYYFEIYDLTGQLKYQGKSSQGSIMPISSHLTHHKPYMLLLRSDDGHSILSRLIIKD